MKKTTLKTVEQANKERFAYYTNNGGKYNYGIMEDNVYSIYRMSDHKLLHKFNILDFRPIK